MNDALSDLFVRFRDQGDADALAEVFDRTAPALLKVAMHIMLDGAAAEDLLQATFVTAMEKAKRFRAEKPLMPWLIGILVLHAKNHLRKRQRAGNGPPPPLPEPPPDPLRQAADQEVLETVATALADTPSPYREVLIAHLRDGKQSREIALELGRAPGTVRSQIHRGLEQLRRLLPKGFLIGGAVIATEMRGLAAIRVAVLREATAVSAAAAVGTTGITVGGLIMAKKTLLVIGLVIAGAVGWQWTQMTPSPPDKVDQTALPAAAEPGLIEEEKRSTDPSRPEREQAADTLVATLLRPLPPERPVGNVVVTGRVVTGPDRMPVPGARVEIRAAWSFPPRYQWETMTAPDGRFRFEKIDLMSSTDLHVEARNFAPTRVRYRHLMTQSPDWETDFDIGDVVIERGERIEGVVLDGSGEPVAGASILLVTTGLEGVFLPGTGTPVGVTNMAGRFAIEHVPTRRYREGSSVQLFAVSQAGLGCGEVRVIPEIGVIRDVALRVAPGCIVEVKATDGSDEPLAGAVVTAVPRFEPLVNVTYHVDEDGVWSGPRPNHYLHLGDHTPLQRMFRAVANADGVATLPSLPLPQAGSSEPAVGPYDLVVRADGFEPAFLDDLHFRPRETRAFDVKLSPVRVTSIVGVVLSASGIPIADRRVGLSRGTGGGPERFPDAVTDAEGRFRFDGLTSEMRYEVWTYQDLETGPHSETVSFVEDQDIAEVEIRLKQTYPITGRLIDQHGRPVPHLLLCVVSEDSPSGRFLDMTEADGSFRIRTTIPGEQELTAHNLAFPPGRWLDTEPRWAVRGGSDDVVLELERGTIGVHAVDVEVVDASSGLPLEIYSADVRPYPPEKWRRTSARAVVAMGRVELDRLEPGDWILSVTMLDRGIYKLQFSVAPGDPRRRLRLEVPLTGGLVGRVSFQGSAPSVPFWVQPDRRLGRVLDPDGRLLPEAINLRAPIDETGRFRFADLSPGPVTLRAFGANVKAEVTAEVLPGVDVEVVLEAEYCGRLRTDGFRDLPVGAGALFLSDLKGKWRLHERYAREDTAVVEQSVLLPPGAGRWRFAFIVGGSDSPPEEWPVIGEGNYTVEAGHRVLLRLKAPP